MSTLVIQLPARSRLQGGAEAVRAPAPYGDAAEFAFVLTPDGMAITQQGRAPAPFWYWPTPTLAGIACRCPRHPRRGCAQP